MKSLTMAFGLFFASTAALANDPVTSIEAFQCHPRGAEQKFIAWTEVKGSEHTVTVGTLGQSGVEALDKFTAGRMDTDDVVVFMTADGKLSLTVTNDFDGEFYAGELSFEKNGKSETQELACESNTTVASTATTNPKSMTRVYQPPFGPRYVWTCTAAPYNNYYYHWFYAQNFYVNIANSQALAYCNNYYGAPICVSSCR